MRQRYQLLLEPDGKPCGGKWNYDSENRKGWRNQGEMPDRPAITQDAVTQAAPKQVAQAFPDNPGDLSRFNYAVTAPAAQQQLN